MSGQQTVEELKQKLEAQEQQFQNYKTQCKQLEQFLEGEAKAKEEEIRKLKEEAIKKQKIFSTSKATISQLQAQNTQLSNELKEIKEKQASLSNQANDSKELLEKIQALSSKNKALQKQIEGLKAEKNQLSQAKNNSKGLLEEKKSIQDALALSKSKVAQLQKQNEKLKQQNSRKPGKQVKVEQKKVVEKVIQRDYKQQEKLKQRISKLQKKLSQMTSDVSKAQQKSIKLSKQLQSSQSKITNLQQQKQNYARKLKQISLNNSSKKQQQKEEQSQIQSQIQQKHEFDQQQPYQQSRLKISALIMTKKHYASPFLEFRSNNQIKILKSTKNGCFQKSMGVLKYKLNEISHNTQQIVQSCAQNLINNLKNGVSSSIVLFGPKKSSKKYLLAGLLTKIKQAISQKLTQKQGKTEVVYINASPNPQNKLQLSGHTKQQIEHVIDKVISFAQKSIKKIDLNKKIVPKPKVRYFRFSFQDCNLQITTTSFTNIPLRQNQTLNEFLNNICYSRLPNVLQPLDCQRQIILTINPIVSLYEDCRNSLSITNYKKVSNENSYENDQREMSPAKQELNDMTRRKLENIQRESQQNTLKIRRQQQQISYYKGRFDELQIRLKNLLNTHKQHNTYLKKSPITLSYQKMLKFVHSVQAKATSQNERNFGMSKVTQFQQEGEQNEAQADEQYTQGHQAEQTHTESQGEGF